MVASLLTPADILTRPKAAHRLSPLTRDFAAPFGGIRHSMASGAEVVANGIDEMSMSFPAIISTPQIDRVGDSLVSPGCDVSEYSTNALIFLNHDSESIPIGVAWDAADRLFVAIEPERVLSRCFCLQSGKYAQDAADVFHLIIQRAFNNTSVGFNPHPDPRFTQRLDTGGNLYSKWILLEWSVVGIAANPGAQIIRKHLSDGRITGKRISPALTKMLTPLAEPKPATVTSGFAASATPAPQSSQSKRSKPMSKRWGKPGRAKRHEAKHIRHEASRPEGHQWVLYSHDMSKVLGTHPTREAAEAQERAVESHKMFHKTTDSSGHEHGSDGRFTSGGGGSGGKVKPPARERPRTSGSGNRVSVREAQDAAMKLGPERTEEIVGPSGLSGASPAALRKLVEEASKHDRGDSESGHSGGGNAGSVSIREAQNAAMKLGDERTEEIVGPGGLSGASAAALRRLVDEARGHGKSMSASSGTAGGYAVAEEMKPEEKPEGMDHERIKSDIAHVMEEHKGGDPDYHHAYYKEETGEVHHTVGDAAEEGHAEKVKAALEGIDGVKEVHQGDEHGPEGEGYEKVFPPKDEEEEEEEESGEAKPEEKAARVARRKAMLAFHVGRGKGFMVAAKALPKAKKDALETCVHAKIPKIAEDHPEMEADQRTAVAYSMCGEKAFDADSYSTKDDLDGDADDSALSAIAPDTTEEKRPPSLTLCQQAIENIESALPGMEPETRDFWEDILQQIRDHGEERYPDEDFGGEETAAETAPSAAEDREFAEDVADAYRESPEEREGAKRARISVQKSLRALRKGDAPAVLESAASHLHAISKHNVGRTLTKSEKDAAADHARSLDRLHGAVTHGMKAESDSEESIGALSASMPMDDDDEAAHEVEKLFGPVVRRAVAKQLQDAAVSSASEKHLESLLERIGNVYGLRTE